MTAEQRSEIIEKLENSLADDICNTDYIREDTINAYAVLQKKGIISKERFETLKQQILNLSFADK